MDEELKAKYDALEVKVDAALTKVVASAWTAAIVVAAVLVFFIMT
jgi:hypothetical protein